LSIADIKVTFDIIADIRGPEQVIHVFKYSIVDKLLSLWKINTTYDNGS